MNWDAIDTVYSNEYYASLHFNQTIDPNWQAAQVTPYYCQNPECSKQIPPKKWKFKPKYCDKPCWLRHLELQRPVCKRPGCEKHLPRNKIAYCSSACYDAVVRVPRQVCARPGCTNIAAHKARAKYCSTACRDADVPLIEKSRRGNAVIAAHKAATGRAPGYAKRAAAVSRNNRIAPPKRKMRRTDTVYGKEVLFEPEGTGYRATVPSVAGIIARHKTKKGALAEIKKLLRAAGEATKR